MRAEANVLKESNKACIHAGKIGFGCYDLIEVHRGCLYGTCPFFKTAEEQAYGEKECRKRLEMLHPEHKYKTRKEVIAELEEANEAYREKKKRGKRATVIQAISHGKVTEYASIEEAADGTKLDPELVRVSLRLGEPIRGIKFKRK